MIQRFGMAPIACALNIYMLLWIYTCAFILCFYCITSSSNFAMLHNVNLNIVNLNTLTLCLSICNRMTSPMQHLLYPLLEVEYDEPHRAHFLTDTDAEVPLPPLRPCTHTWAHQWDERYAPYIRRAGFLELVRVVNYGLSPLDPALLTATVDRCEYLHCT